MQKTEHGTLTIHEAHQLGRILDLVQRGARVVWLDPDVTGNEPQTGTARSIGDENGNFITGSDDVRDAFLRITTSRGFELFMPIKKAMHLVSMD